MKLWILEPQDDLPKGSDPWRGSYDMAFGFVVCASDEVAARQMASEQAGDEGKSTWLDSNLSKCVELTASAELEGVIMRDFNAG